jgi:hypothetical protein
MGYRNVTIRFNSVSRGATIDTSTMADSNCRFENVQVYGNVAGVRSGSCVAGISYRHNVYRIGGTCHPSEHSLGGAGVPFYARDVHAPGPRDYRLAGPRSRADDVVPAAAGCPVRDKLGSPRGGNGRCDAGAYER